MTHVTPELMVMMDIESFSLSPLCVITHFAAVAFLPQELSPLPGALPIVGEYYTGLPVYPQQKLLVPARDISFETLMFWMNQPPEAREIFDHPLLASRDFQDLGAICRQISREFAAWTAGYNPRAVRYCSKNSKFDFSALDTLFESLNMETPWAHAHREVVDLRTMMDEAQMSDSDFDRPSHLLKHHPLHDCHHQIRVYNQIQRKLGGSNGVIATSQAKDTAR